MMDDASGSVDICDPFSTRLSVKANVSVVAGLDCFSTDKRWSLGCCTVFKRFVSKRESAANFSSTSNNC
uniref:Uncharacterized protein n=1 Tax=Parascaris univalens TaxID=6257 RepID=A0A915AJ56_PARUN